MKLFYNPASSYSQRVLIALHEKNISFIPIEVDLFDIKVRADYQKINPFLKIPCLETDDGHILFESCIIIEYLDFYIQQEPNLIPKEPKLAIEVRRFERIVDIYINYPRQILFRDSQRQISMPDSEEVIKAKRSIEIACAYLNEQLQYSTWLASENFSFADCTAAPTLSYLRMNYSYDHLPRLVDYVKRLEARPSIARVQSQGQIRMLHTLAKTKLITTN
jgi:glutathione S-transferase